MVKTQFTRINVKLKASDVNGDDYNKTNGKSGMEIINRSKIRSNKIFNIGIEREVTDKKGV